ncbi:MAG TPA: hypothetical protein VH681_14510 [Nitrospiraceae bacterium]
MATKQQVLDLTAGLIKQLEEARDTLAHMDTSEIEAEDEGLFGLVAVFRGDAIQDLTREVPGQLPYTAKELLEQEYFPTVAGLNVHPHFAHIYIVLTN